MNKKTFLSKFPRFRKSWYSYIKRLYPKPLGWTVMSDYCLDNQEKNDCIVFIISPILGQPEQMGKFLNKKLSSDIKHLKIIPQDTIEFIRDFKVFFSIVFILQEKQKLVNMQYFKTDIRTLSESPMIMGESRKRIKQFSESLKQKCLGEKTLKNMFLISFLFGRIVEFLTIKHFAEGINWFPDRDSVMNSRKWYYKRYSKYKYT